MSKDQREIARKLRILKHAKELKRPSCLDRAVLGYVVNRIAASRSPSANQDRNRAHRQGARRGT